MVLDHKSAGALILGTKPSEVIMSAKTIKVLRRFYINGVVQEIGKKIQVSATDAVAWVGTNKAEIVPDEPEKIEAKKEEPKKEEPKAGASRGKESPAETKKGGVKNDSI